MKNQKTWTMWLLLYKIVATVSRGVASSSYCFVSTTSALSRALQQQQRIHHQFVSPVAVAPFQNVTAKRRVVTATDCIAHVICKSHLSNAVRDSSGAFVMWYRQIPKRRSLSPTLTSSGLKSGGEEKGARGVKLQQQLVYPGILARMLTLSFTSHLLSY